MNKKLLKNPWLWALLIAVLAGAVLALVLNRGNAPRSPANVNLIGETDFSLLQNGGGAWYEDAYVMRQEYTEFSFEEMENGIVAGHIVNKIGNDARFAMDLSVEPDSLYLLSGWVRADCREGLGANLSVSGVYAFSDPLYDTRGDYERVTFYGRTGKDQTGLTVYARLGGYSGEAVGEAWFYGIELCRVDALPDGVRAAVWYTEPARDEEASSASPAGALLPSLALILFSLIYLALLLWATAHRTDDRLLRRWPAAAALLAGALILRITLMYLVHGYDVDVGDFRGWAQTMAEHGPGAFYAQAGFCDYPPGYIWILGFFATLASWFGLPVSEALIKLPPVLSDLLGAGLLCWWCLKNHPDSRSGKGWPLSALIPAALYLVNPMVLLTGAGWGQSDGVMMLFLLITVLSGMSGKWQIALPAYVTAVLVKPQALMFGPLGLAALCMSLYQAYRQDKAAFHTALRRFLIGAAVSAALAALIILPFRGSQPFGWLISLYQRTMSYYASATVNACNLYFLAGANWVSTSANAEAWTPVLAGLLLLIPSAIALPRALKGGKALKILTLSVASAGALVLLSALFPFSYQTYSTLLIVLSLAIVLCAFIISGNLRHLPLYGAVLLTLLFNLGGMMHERYLFAALPLLILAWYIERDDRVPLLLGLVTVSSFLNAGCVLSRNARIGGADGHLSAPLYSIESDMAALEYLSAGLSVLSAGLGLFLGLRIAGPDFAPVRLPALLNPKLKNIDSACEPAAPLPPQENGWLASHRMDKKDWLIVLSITVLYACLAFWSLGSTTSPQTGYMFTGTDETVTFDLGQHRDNFRMLYIGGVHQYDRDFTVSLSDDGENWPDSFDCDMDIGNLFQWYYVRSWRGTDNLSLSGRYVRITGRPGLNLYEVIFRDDQGNVLPIQSAQSSLGTDVSALWDEQDTLSGEPGWYNSMYFDEIYHARTAYEHLTGQSPYETTHPPLGKVIMSWCVALFGMTPFGWRFAGTLCGVMMLPAMYLLGRLLFKKRRFAVMSMLMMTLDTLHYTQTRLATIDSFVVLFILWSVYFMLRWFWTDFEGVPLRKSLLPLGLSGLFMGLAVASKWTGCYAGVGLAALFFTGIWRRLRALHQKSTDDGAAHDKKADRQGYCRIALTVLSCLVFFVAVPALIYYLSYIPYFAPSGGVTLRKVIDAANGMLSYHSQPGLGMDHPFYSPWYEWPFSAKPMYYAADGYEPQGFASTILAFGNPAVWWVGFLAMLMVLYAFVRHQAVPALLRAGYPSRPGPFRPAGGRDLRPLLLTICFLSQYLPWMLVPRGTYIYHYFPSVPFIILATALIAEYWTDWRADHAARSVSGEAASAERAARSDRRSLLFVILYLILCAALFIAFFPYASGIMVKTSWLDAMNWFGNLYY